MSTDSSLKVSDIILKPQDIPILGPKDLVKQALEQMSSLRLGVVCVVDTSNTLLGVFTDGDIRRLLINDQKPLSAIFADDIITHANVNPLTVEENFSLLDAVNLIEKKKVWYSKMYTHRNQREMISEFLQVQYNL